VPDTVSLVQPRPNLGSAPLPTAEGTRPGRQISRPVLALAIQTVDFALLFLAGLVATQGYEILLKAIPAGDLAVATWIGASATVIAIRKANGYTLPRLGQLIPNPSD